MGPCTLVEKELVSMCVCVCVQGAKKYPPAFLVRASHSINQSRSRLRSTSAEPFGFAFGFATLPAPLGSDRLPAPFRPLRSGGTSSSSILGAPDVAFMNASTSLSSPARLAGFVRLEEAGEEEEDDDEVEEERQREVAGDSDDCEEEGDPRR